MADPRETARRFVADVKRSWGDRLRAAVLHGSVPRGHAIPGVSDINLLLLIDGIRMEDLEAAGPDARRWIEMGNAAPMVLDATDWRRATDVFAVEIADMLDHREVLVGEDPLAGVAVSRDALRFQLEHELRASLVRLHDTLMVSAEHPRDIGALLLRALPSFEAYLRATLRLAGRAVPDDAEGTIAEAAEVVGGDPSGLLEARRARQEGAAPARTLAHPGVESYYRLMERTVRYVDGVDHDHGNAPQQESRT
jgi:predicted nucleotidyltransferase